MKRSALLLLILCNLAWTFNPLMGKVLLSSYSGLQVAWLRYMGAFVSYVLVVAVMLATDRKKKWQTYFLIPKQYRIWIELFALGVGPFVLSPILQFVALESVQAMDNSILIATEPLITVFLAWLLLRERMTRDHWISMTLALIGFVFFSGLFGGWIGYGAGFSVSLGMSFLLFAQVGEGAYSVLSRKLVQVYSPTTVLGSGLAIGAILLTAIVAAFDHLPGLGVANFGQLGAVFWLGPIGSTLTYLVWATIARTVTVPSMAITLFIQPVLGSFVGYLVLAESLTVERLAGALMILAAIAFLFWREIRRGPEIL
jgi:drug/metabolite transporter (DMT)-like permease